MTEFHDGPSDGTTINGEPPPPRRSWIRENWYRDVWLIVITALLVISLLSFEGTQNDFEDQQKVLVQLARTNRVISGKLCKVVINVHDANKVKAKSERRRLQQTRIYLQHLDPGEENSNLTQRVRAGLPNTISDVKAAKKSERATRPPKECLQRAREISKTKEGHAQ